MKIRHLTVPGFSLLLAMTAFTLVSVEWSHPYCSNPYDGPASAILGSPLPFLQNWGSSLEYVFLPHMALLNIGLLWGLMHVPSRLAASMLPEVGARARTVIFCGSILGLTLLLAVNAVPIAIGAWHPGLTIDAYPDSLLSLRPVRLFPGLPVHCSPLS